MTIEEINEMVKRHDTLTPEEKETLKNGILKNDEARSIAIGGALSEGNFQLAVSLVLNK